MFVIQETLSIIKFDLFWFAIERLAALHLLRAHDPTVGNCVSKVENDIVL